MSFSLPNLDSRSVKLRNLLSGKSAAVGAKKLRSDLSGEAFLSSSGGGTNNIPCASQVAKCEEHLLLSTQNSVIPALSSCSELGNKHSVDTLSVSLWLDWFHVDFLNQLAVEMRKARELDVPSSCIEFHGQQWNVHRFAPSYYKYHFSSGDIDIYLSSHSAHGRIANCKIDIGSLSCWAGGEKLFNQAKNMLGSHGCQCLKEVVGRVDTCVDVLGVSLSDQNITNLDFWVRKSTKFGYFGDNSEINTFTLGKGNMMLRIYNKVAELKQKKATNKQKAFAKIWGVREYDEKAVTRVEFQVRREVLAQFQKKTGERITTVSELYKGLSSLWAYQCGVWARHNIAPVDRSNKHQSRSELSSFWREVASVDWCGDGGFVRLVKKTRKNIDALKEQIRGLLITVIAEQGVEVDDYWGIMSKGSEIITTTLNDYILGDTVSFMKKYCQRASECNLMMQLA